MKLFLLTLMLAIASPAVAQQAPDVATMQKAILVLQQQRNAAMDQAAGSQVDVQKLTEENSKLKAEIEDLKKKIPASKPAEPKP